jgi:HPt (histidine-containing phosphotransfer) domain-containing protein
MVCHALEQQLDADVAVIVTTNLEQVDLVLQEMQQYFGSTVPASIEPQVNAFLSNLLYKFFIQKLKCGDFLL